MKSTIQKAADATENKFPGLYQNPTSGNIALFTNPMMAIYVVNVTRSQIGEKVDPVHLKHFTKFFPPNEVVVLRNE